MKDNHRIGAILAVLGILTGLLIFYLLASTYNPVRSFKMATDRMDEAASVTITYAVLGWIGTAAGALWASVLYGFLHREKWAWYWGAVAATVQLLAGFFPAIPAMDSHLPTPTLIVFGLALVLWFGMLLIGGVQRGILTLTFVAGLAYVLSFIDGVAPIAKYTTSHDDSFWNGMYVITQQVSWWGSAAWAVFIFAVLGKRPWALPLGIFAGMMSMLSGFPLGIHNVFEVGRFSMFLPAPLLGMGLVIFLLLPSTRKMLEAWNAG